MGNKPGYLGVNFATLRKALYLLYFGADEGACNDFSSPKYKYIIPMQGNFENPIEPKGKDTYLMYWIEQDKSLTQDDTVIIDDEGYSRQKCVASILIRTVGKDAETWIKAFRHLIKRNNVSMIWQTVCNATKLEHTSPVIPRKIAYSGLNSQVAFDVRFKLHYDEVMSTGWKPLEGIDFAIEGEIR